MEVLMDALQYVQEVSHNYRGEITDKVLGEYGDVFAYSCVLYILLVFLVPQHIMKHREPLDLRIPFILWNFIVCVFSILGAITCVELMQFLLRDRGFYRSTCFFDAKVTYNGKYAFWIFCFILSKIPEMLDTAFLVFQKKPVIFLHWYHHLTVMLFCWHSAHALVPSGLWFATMNYCVHSIMYFYYFICACGLRKVVRPIAPLITALQILQMVVGTGIVVYTAYHTYFSGYGCGVSHTSIRLGLVIYASYFVLFAVLFRDLYLSKKRDRFSSAAGKFNGKKMN